MKISSKATIAIAMTLLCGSVLATNYEVVIKNGRVVDPETGYDAIANVGVNNDYITTITNEQIEGTRELDATGYVVAPGFIDFHSHGQEPFAFRLYARDVVTTAMDLEMGSYPIDEYYDYWEGKSPLNYGTTDNATVKTGENSLPSTGIPYVLVNGQGVADDSKVQRVAAGVAMRNQLDK